jgi:hypothetical protein
MSKKLSRSLLKEIVKECLVELLFEGLDSDELLESVQPRSSRRQSQSLMEEVERQRPVRKAKPKASPRPAQKPRLVEQAEQSISGLTDDPVMADIFRDTANTTLVEQMANEGRGHAPATPEAAVVDQVEDMEELFEGASNWAAIAFGNTPET